MAPTATPAGYIAATAPINPPSAPTVLTRAQVWAGLEIKIEEAQVFVPMGITSTDVIEKKHDEHGRAVIVREVVFKEDGRRVREVVTCYEPTFVVFGQPDGSRVQNIISDGANGELYMTYVFEWMAPDADAETLARKTAEWKKMAHGAVQSSIDAIRDLVQKGRITA